MQGKNMQNLNKEKNKTKNNNKDKNKTTTRKKQQQESNLLTQRLFPLDWRVCLQICHFRIFCHQFCRERFRTHESIVGSTAEQDLQLKSTHTHTTHKKKKIEQSLKHEQNEEHLVSHSVAERKTNSLPLVASAAT